MLKDATLSGWFRGTSELQAWRHLAAGGPHELGRQLQHQRPCGVHQGGILSSMDTRSVRIVGVLVNDNISFITLPIDVKYVTKWLIIVLTNSNISTQTQRPDRQPDRRNTDMALGYELQCRVWCIAVRHIHNCCVQIYFLSNIIYQYIYTKNILRTNHAKYQDSIHLQHIKRSWPTHQPLDQWGPFTNIV